MNPSDHITRRCVICDNSFDVRGRAKAKQITCSNACAKQRKQTVGKAWRLTNRESYLASVRKRERAKLPIFFKQCAICSFDFATRDDRDTCCSKKCSVERRRAIAVRVEKERRARDKEQYNEAARNRRIRDREKILERLHTRRSRDPDKFREQSRKHHIRRIAAIKIVQRMLGNCAGNASPIMTEKHVRQRAWARNNYQKNREKILAAQKKRYWQKQREIQRRKVAEASAALRIVKQLQQGIMP